MHVPDLHVPTVQKLLTLKGSDKKFTSMQKSPLSFLLAIDAELSEALYAIARQNAIICALANLISFSIDEVIWFGVPSFLGCAIFSFRFIFGFPMGCVEEFAWDCFGSCAVGTCFESIFKWIFRRVRPKYSAQASNYSISGEWYSFPSGWCIFFTLFCISIIVKLCAKAIL